MRGEDQILKAETVGDFEKGLNVAGGEGWEAISGGYAVGESLKVSLGHGMPLTTKPGNATWSALMKRALEG